MDPGDIYAFIDESGNEGLSAQPQVSKRYVIVAIIVNGQDLAKLRKHFEQVRSGHFQGEMKSKHVGKDYSQRRDVLRALIHTDYSLYVLVCAKGELKSPGYAYPKTFVKNLHGRLYKSILHDLHVVQIRADRLKNPPFMKEFEAYMTRENPMNLFQPWVFEFVDSKTDVCIQAADFIAGTIAQGYERDDAVQSHNEFMHILKKQISYFEVFPHEYQQFVFEVEGQRPADFDFVIAQRSLEDASRFAHTYQPRGDPEVLYCLECLLTHSRWGREGWLATDELLSNLNGICEDDVSEQKLRSLIGRLRDHGILVASRRAGGYRLAVCEADLYEFLNTQNSKVGPMVERIRKARETVHRATGRKFDILAKDEYHNLRAAIDATQPWALQEDEGVPD